MKDEILQIALKQFLKLGIRQTSVQKLVEPLGISTKTLYKYYDNKEHLLADCLRLYYSQQIKLFGQFENNQNAAEILFDAWHHGIVEECKINKVFFEDLNYYFPELENKIQKEVGKNVILRFKEIIERGVADGIFRSDINADIFLEALSAIYLGITRSSNFKRYKLSIDRIYLNSIAVLIRGICTVESIRSFDKYVSKVLPAISLN